MTDYDFIGIDLGYELCPYCGKRKETHSLHVPKPEWGERQCEIVTDFQYPVLEVAND